MLIEINEITNDDWTAYAVCRRYGVLWAYDYEDEGIKVFGSTQPYIRGKTIELCSGGFNRQANKFCQSISVRIF